MASSIYTSIQFKPINTKGKIANTVNGNGSKTLACELSRQGEGAGNRSGPPPMTTYTNIRPKTAQGGSLDWDIAAGIIAVWHVVWFASASPSVSDLPWSCATHSRPALMCLCSVY